MCIYICINPFAMALTDLPIYVYISTNCSCYFMLFGSGIHASSRRRIQSPAKGSLARRCRPASPRCRGWYAVLATRLGRAINDRFVTLGLPRVRSRSCLCNYFKLGLYTWSPAQARSLPYECSTLCRNFGGCSAVCQNYLPTTRSAEASL